MIPEPYPSVKCLQIQYCVSLVDGDSTLFTSFLRLIKEQLKLALNFL